MGPRELAQLAQQLMRIDKVHSLGVRKLKTAWKSAEEEVDGADVVEVALKVIAALDAKSQQHVVGGHRRPTVTSGAKAAAVVVESSSSSERRAVSARRDRPLSAYGQRVLKLH